MKPVELPLSDVIKAKTHPPRYMMHKFWARKPHNVIATYIEHFTDPGDVVMDPFCGSGVTICEALHARRKAVGLDVNPIAIFVSRMTCLPLDIPEFEDMVGRIAKSLAELTEHSYETLCPECHHAAEATHFVWVNEATCEWCGTTSSTDESNRKGGYFYCLNCGHRLKRGDTDQERLVKILLRCDCDDSANLKEKDPDEHDLRRATVSTRGSSVREEFSMPLTVNARHDVSPGMTVGSLFTQRAQGVISSLRESIAHVPCSDATREFLLLAFTASLPQSSRLHSIDFRPGRRFRSRGWTIPSYWIASGHFEQNARLSFLERCGKVLRGKRDANDFIPTAFSSEVADFKSLITRSGGFLFGTTSASQLPDLLEKNSVDYVFTDPPYGDSITYLELSEIWNVWLQDVPRAAYDDEVVISDAEGREKTLDRYQLQLRDGFEAVHRVMRPGAWMSVTFHNRNIAVWNALLNAAVDAHFDFVNDVYQLPAAASAKSGLQRAGSMTGDIILNFRKPLGVPSRLRAHGVDVEQLIVDEASQIIAERRGRASEDQLMRGVVHVLLRHGVVDRSPDDVRTVLGRYLDRTEDGDWTFQGDTAAETLMDFVPLEKRIHWLIESVLGAGSASLDTILGRIFTTLKNGRTPESREISQVLDRIAILMPNGKWRRRTVDDAAVQLTLGETGGPLPEGYDDEGENQLTHDQFVRIVAEWAYLAGDGAWIGQTEQNRNPRLRALSLPRLTIPGLIPQAIDDNRINEIDVAWLRGGTAPLALFEIEHTTRAMTCIPRMGNLTRLLPHLALDVFIIAPDGLEQHVLRQMQAPSAQAIIRDHPSRWYFLPYTEVLRLDDARREGQQPIHLDDIRSSARPLD